MANTYIAIATITVGSGGQTELDFNNIPQTYTDLVVKIASRSDGGAGTQDRIGLKINNAGFGNWSLKWLGYSNGSVLAATEGAFGSNQLAYTTSTSVTAGAFANTEVYIVNYANTTKTKTISVDGVAENNSSTTFWGLNAPRWQVTDAITRLTFVLASGAKFEQYSTATLYGIKNS